MCELEPLLMSKSHVQAHQRAAQALPEAPCKELREPCRCTAASAGAWAWKPGLQRLHGQRRGNVMILREQLAEDIMEACSAVTPYNLLA